MGNHTRFMKLYAQVKARDKNVAVDEINLLQALEVIMACMEDLKEDLGDLREQAGFE